MSPTGRIAYGVLVISALFALVSLAYVVRDWTAIWRGFDSLTMGIDEVVVSDDRQTIEVVASFVNHSDQTIQIHTFESGVRLSGRSVTGNSQSYNDLFLPPGEATSIRLSARVSSFDRELIDDAVRSGTGTWNISGRVRASVDELSDSLWLPYRSNLEVGR